MRLLLDTHALLWWLAGNAKLPRTCQTAISRSAQVYVSAVTAWEIAIKKALGKLDAPGDLEQAIEESRFLALPITVPHALAAGALPRHHDDPFDRMLVAQARSEGLTLVTRDERFQRYGVPTLWD